jgi:multidrug resistance protein, MATE family
VLIARLGTASVAGHQVVANIAAVLFMVPLAIGIATSVLVAQSLGANHPRVARAAALRGFRLSIAVALVAATGVWLMREPLVALYTTDAAVSAIALTLIGWTAVFHVFDAGQGISGFALRGYKNTLWPMVIYGVSLWGVGLIGGYWIAFNDTLLGAPRGAVGFWEAATVALAFAAISLSWLANVGSRRTAQNK